MCVYKREGCGYERGIWEGEWLWVHIKVTYLWVQNVCEFVGR